ncbi:MAG TPA: hypothetical protein VGF59_14030 [Bryobacteraceae bacterium]
MRYFLTGRQPAPNAILLVESGSRGLLEGLIVGMRQTWGDDMFIDLVTCYARLPRGFASENTRVYRVSDYRGREPRGRLYQELAGNRYSTMGIICSGEPVMTKWKWALALRIPAKVFIINENGDYFWVDRKHLKTIRRFVLLRAGLAGAGAVRTLVRILLFPITLLYLLLYATAVHSRRALRRRITNESHSSI